MWMRYFVCLCWIVNLSVLPYCLSLRIPLFITPLKELPQPNDKTSSFYKPAERNEFFSRVTAWDVWRATNISVSGIHNSSVHRIISRANILYEDSILNTSNLNGYHCGSYCYVLNISSIEYHSGKTRQELNGRTRPAITLGGLHEAVVKTLNDHFCITMSSIEEQLGISSFNVTLREWKSFLPHIAWYAIQCRADLLAVSRSELAELVRNDEATLLDYSLAQLDSELILPYQKIDLDKEVFETHKLKRYVTANDDDDDDDDNDDDDDDDDDDGSEYWTSLPLHYYTQLATNFSTRDLQILYNWNSTQLFALQFINLKSYNSCNDAISLNRTLFHISQSILQDFSCPVVLVLSSSVGYVQSNTDDIEKPLELSVLTIFSRVTQMDWIKIADILELNYTDGILIDTPRLQEITRDNFGLGQDDIIDLSVPEIITNYISLDSSVYVYINYAPMFNDMLTTYGFTRKELSKAYGETITDQTTIITVHEWLLKVIASRYNVHNITYLIGYTQYFPNDSDLRALPSTKWPEIIDAVIQQSFMQVMKAFSYSLQTNPDSVSISLQPDNFKTIKTTTSSFSIKSINDIAFCLFKKTKDSFNSSNFRDYHKFYNNTLAKTMMKKIQFETESLDEILSQKGLSLKELDDVLLTDLIRTETRFQLFEIECLYGESIISGIDGITWGEVSEKKLCYSFTNLTLLQIVMAVRDAPTVNCDADVDVDECSEQSPCHSKATCKNSIGSYICTCKVGYVGNGVVCADKDECAGQSICHSDATCQNTIGSYKCSCKPGFSGNGKTKCTALDQGSSNPSSSSKSNTGVIIGAVVAAVVVLVTVIVIVACFFYRRTSPQDKERNIGEIVNPAYMGENQRNRRLPKVPYSESGYEEPVETEYAQLDSSKRVPIDANYQSLKHRDKPGASGDTGDYAVLEGGENEERYASSGNKSANNLAEAYVTVVGKESGGEGAKESLYEELP